ncbi:MAG: ATP-dependent zinc protease [Proteobacteria bacterium]|nr:ATP-dependent zinc protease [Pseudomonadota bacterium]
MAQCDSRQAEYNQQLQHQGRQLESQGRQLDKIAGAQVLALEALPRPQEYPANSPVGALCAPQETLPEKLVVGRHEQVWLEDIQLALPARVDTGAETASLDARNIERFERNGKRWVRFEILHPDSGEALLLERRLKRTVSIIQSNTSEPERRPVIKLGITMGHITQSAEFTLSNRSHLDYQLLIGRNILKDVMVVDVSKINVAPPVLSK